MEPWWRLDRAECDESNSARSVKNGGEVAEIWREEEIGARMGENCWRAKGDTREGLLSVWTGGYGRLEAVRAQGS